MNDYKVKYQELYNTGESLRDNQINSMKRKIIDSFVDSPSYYSVSINNSMFPTDVWIVDDSDSKELKRIQTKPDEANLSVGDLVKCKDNYWLVQIVDDMEVYNRGIIQKCNSTFPIKANKTRVLLEDANGNPKLDKFGDPVYTYSDGAITYLPCIVDSSFAGSDENKQLPLPQGQLRVTMQYQNVDDIQVNKTFSMYNNTYKIRNIDYTKVINNKGIVVLSVEQVTSEVK